MIEIINFSLPVTVTVQMRLDTEDVTRLPFAAESPSNSWGQCLIVLRFHQSVHYHTSQCIHTLPHRNVSQRFQDRQDIFLDW